jgi:eukaryotic-like serine/threonine-protein kinase
VAVKPGDILGTKYRVDALIGRGGMGHVFAATDLEGPSSPVAIKVVSRMVFDETLMARLHREAEAAARIRSDYVPRLLEVSDTDEKEMFLVMERLVGEPLSQRMRDKGALPWPEVVQIGEDVLRGLIDAHTAGVVHRDLKPSNVFLASKAGRVRAMVLDFGVCKMDTVDTQHLTGTGESIGTVAYMAPEQIRGASKVDDRADLYAFGVLVFEMLCGRLPHDGPSQMAILASKLENEPDRVRNFARVAVPEGLDGLVAKALIRDPNARFASAQELLKAWRRLGVPGLALPTWPAHAAVTIHDAPTTVGHDFEGTMGHGGDAMPPVETHPTQTALTGAISLRKGSGGGRVAFALAAFALLIGVVSVGAFFARGPDRPPASTSAGASPSESARTGESASASALEESAPVTPAIEFESTDLDDAGGAAKVRAKGRASRPPPHPHGDVVPSPRSSGPHITAQPRY